MNEIKWDDSKATITTVNYRNVPIKEQELLINHSKRDGCVYISCSYTKYINRLTKLSYFKVDTVEINKKQQVLFVEGTLPSKAYTLRKDTTKPKQNTQFCNTKPQSATIVKPKKIRCFFCKRKFLYRRGFKACGECKMMNYVKD